MCKNYFCKVKVWEHYNYLKESLYIFPVCDDVLLYLKHVTGYVVWWDRLGYKFEKVAWIIYLSSLMYSICQLSVKCFLWCQCHFNLCFFVQMQLYLITRLIATEISTHYSGLIPLFLSVVWLYLQCTAFYKLLYHNFTCYSIIRR